MRFWLLYPLQPQKRSNTICKSGEAIYQTICTILSQDQFFKKILKSKNSHKNATDCARKLFAFCIINIIMSHLRTWFFFPTIFPPVHIKIYSVPQFGEKDNLHKGLVTLKRVAPSNIIWNEFRASHSNSFLPFFSVSQWEAWNLFQMTSDGAKF